MVAKLQARVVGMNYLPRCAPQDGDEEEPLPVGPFLFHGVHRVAGLGLLLLIDRQRIENGIECRQIFLKAFVSKLRLARWTKRHARQCDQSLSDAKAHVDAMLINTSVQKLAVPFHSRTNMT